jgi:16S rRNA (adenine1518-N6/adenine1519-N6)-dimethyltransferase
MHERANRPAPPKRSLGQNFLVDENVCRRIVEAARPPEGGVLVEIGPGRGALTRFFAELALERYVALEKDHALAAELGVRFPGVEVVDGDALEFNWEALDGPTLAVAGNLPYNVASRIIWEVASRLVRFRGAVFMVQHEVALRLCAGPGGRDYGALTAWVQAHCRADYLFKVPPTVFRPRPKVDSAVVRLAPLPQEQRPEAPGRLAALLRLCFQKRRKQLGTILKGRLPDAARRWFEEEDIPLTARPETLSPGQFASLSRFFEE